MNATLNQVEDQEQYDLRWQIIRFTTSLLLWVFSQKYKIRFHGFFYINIWLLFLCWNSWGSRLSYVILRMNIISVCTDWQKKVSISLYSSDLKKKLFWNIKKELIRTLIIKLYNSFTACVSARLSLSIMEN